MKLIIIIAVSATTILSACKKESAAQYNNNVKAPLSIEFDNIVGSSNLQLNTGVYQNAVGQNFSVTKLKYYISNIKLTNSKGEVFVVPQNESYFLIDEAVPSSHKPVVNIPEGEYTKLDFVLGIDSLRNTMDVSQRTGALDVSGAAADMYWTWNSGYIFFKLEGTSPIITSMGGVFQYHVGGFGGYSTPTISNLKNFSIDLTARGIPKVMNGRTPNVHLFVDVMKAISGSTNYDFSTTTMIHSPAAAVPIRNNYSNMFSHDHTEN
ncbi:MAG: hypothetical protein EOP53_15190 [Sphingobacteriales bacterium]|nr:MAG: hypothetical protein EOP53_15190 [Sphingobacteriales bacterium]